MIAHSKIWLHVIIYTHNKLPLILPDNESKIYSILSDCFSNQDTKVEKMNGTSEHIHIKLLLNPGKSLNEVVQNVMIESEQIINQELFKAGSFQWSKEYSAFSISESQLTKVSEYIDNQKEFHKQKLFQKEIEEFHRLHGI